MGGREGGEGEIGGRGGGGRSEGREREMGGRGDIRDCAFLQY